MTDHPLTDEMCESICQNCNTWKSQNKIWFESMRAAYDLAVEQITEQWEEVIDSNRTDIQVIREFDKRLKAMRPQQQENNQ